MNLVPPPLVVYLSVLVFCFGACVGSFLNVCIYRIPRDESVVRPRSHCPHCGRLVAWYDNIPLLSFFALGGRCRHCGASISPRYLLVEFSTAVVFLLIWMEYGLNLRTPVYGLVAAGLILGTFVDFEHMIIPDRVTIGGMITGPVCSLLVPRLHGTLSRVDALVESLMGLAVGFGSLWLVGRLGKMAFKRDAMGFGDVKLLGAIGAYVGWQGVLFSIMLSSLIGSIVGVTLILLNKKQWQSRIPYGPYLAAAALVWILWGHEWLRLYARWLSYPTY